MESVIGPNMSAAQDISSPSESSTDPPDLTCPESGYLSMNDLKNCLNNLESTEDFEISHDFIPSPEENNAGNVEKDVEQNKSNGSKLDSSASEKLIISKCTTITAPATRSGHNKLSAEDLFDGKEKQVSDTITEVLPLDGDAKSADQTNSNCSSLPNPLESGLSRQTPMKLVSAMKGSREKRGVPHKTLSVMWAPEVYDPVPSAVSHVASNKNHRHRSDSKKHGKSKQKNSSKSSRGSKSKDKKQARKSVGNGSSSRSFKSFDDHNILYGFDEPLTGIEGFDIGSPVAFCGSSFLKKSVTKLHYPITEAT